MSLNVDKITLDSDGQLTIPRGTTLPVSGMVAGDLFFKTDTLVLYVYNGTSWQSATSDSDAIHKSVSGEITALTEKTDPVGDDVLVIEDSENSYSKRKSKLSSLKTIFTQACIVGGSTGYAGNQTGYLSWHGFFTSETSTQRRMPKCTVKRLTINVSSNTLNSASTFTVRKNGGNTALSVTVPATSTGIFTATADVDFADGDLFSIIGVLGGTGGQGFYPKGGDVEVEAEVR